MKLTFEQIKSFTHGAVRFTQTDEAVRFYRFTEEQESVYKKERPEWVYSQIYSSSGIKIEFNTDSTSMLLKVNTWAASSRTYFSIDIFADEKNVGNIDNFSNITLKENYTVDSYSLGEFARLFELGDGIKKVSIYLPWSVVSEIKEIELDDNSFAEPIKHEKILLAFGDSITQGYDTLRPCNHYINRLAKMMNVDVYNKGIGGEIFFPVLSECKDDFKPDYITVAYGTNDWFSIDKEIFKERCRNFYKNLSNNYPDSRIFALSPTWRKNYTDEKLFGNFENVGKYIEDIVKYISNITYIDGFDLIPHNPKMFGDLSLHPNDEGFGHYAKELYDKIKGCI